MRLLYWMGEWGSKAVFGPPPDQKLHHKELHHVAILVLGFTFEGDEAALGLGSGGLHLRHFALHMQDVAGASGNRPGKFAAGPDHAAPDLGAAVDLKPHGDGGGVPAAGREVGEETILRRQLVGV